MVTPNIFVNRLINAGFTFLLRSYKYLRIMLESYFQPKIKRKHEKDKNVRPRAKKKTFTTLLEIKYSVAYKV